MASTFKQLGGEVFLLRRLVEKENKNWSAFNPSICLSPTQGYAIAFRSSNYVILESGELYVVDEGSIKNHVWFSELNDDLTLKNLRKIDFSQSGVSVKRGVEDPKLLWRDGRWAFTGVMMESHTPVARHCFCTMNDDATAVTSIQIHEGIIQKKPEKNWMTANYKPEHFDYIYGPNAIIKDNKIIFTMNDNKEFVGLRGNSHLLELEDGTYLAIMHKLWSKTYDMFSKRHFGTVRAKEKDYYHYFARFDRYGTLIELSERFQFVSPGIEFAAGLVEKDNNYVISFGKEDVSSHLAVIPKNKIWKIMKKVS